MARGARHERPVGAFFICSRRGAATLTMAHKLRAAVSLIQCLLMVVALAYLPGPLRHLSARTLQIVTALLAIVPGLAYWAA